MNLAYIRAKIIHPWIILSGILLFTFFLLNCSASRDEGTQATSSCDASDCHTSTQLRSYYPSADPGHITHVAGKGFDCSVCHYSYDNNPAHKNGKIDSHADSVLTVFFDKNLYPAGEFDLASSTCRNLVCHGNFRGGNDNAAPVWGGTVDCETARCHGGNSSGNPASSGNADSAHGTHVNMLMNVTNPGTGLNYTESESCSVCHSGGGFGATTHNDGQIDIAFDYPQQGSLGSFTGGDINPLTGQYNTVACSNTYCHGNFAGGNAATVSWRDTVACGSCHGSSGNNYSSASHGKHTAVTSNYFNQPDSIESCDACHNYGTDTVRAFGSNSTQGSYGTGNHANFSTDVNFKANNADLAARIGNKVSAKTTWNSSAHTCVNSYCHGNFLGSGSIVGNNAMPDWLDPTTGACGTCHDATAPATGSHTKHTAGTPGNYSYGCSICHGELAGHVNGVIGIGGTNYAVQFSGIADQGPGTIATYDSNTKTCAYTYCHGDFRATDNTQWLEGNSANTATWGSTAPCGTCHGTTIGNNAGLGIPNANNLWSANESHVKHAGVNAGNGYKYPCGFCHYGVYDATLSTGNGTGGLYESGAKTPNYAVHADGNRTALSFYASFNSSGNAVVNGLQDVTCSSLYCHSDGWDTTRTVADAGGISSPRWGGASKSTVACDSCHRNAAGSPAPRHNTSGEGHYNPDEHETTCGHCHKYVTSSSGETPSNSSDTILFSSNRHVNRWKNISFGADTSASGSNYYYTRTNGRCYVNCHGENHSPNSGWYNSTFSGSMIYEP